MALVLLAASFLRRQPRVSVDCQGNAVLPANALFRLKRRVNYKIRGRCNLLYSATVILNSSAISAIIFSERK